MVIFEAARAITELSGVTSRELTPAITVLQLLLISSKPVLRFAAVRTLNKVAMTQPLAVTNCNIDMESLISDQNRSIDTLAITTLLKTGNESSVDRLMKQITNFMSDIAEEFKIIVVEAIRSLCLKFPLKYISLFIIDEMETVKGFAKDSTVPFREIKNHSWGEYWKLNDSILKTIETDEREELKESRDMILRIRRRDLYKFCNEFTVPKDQLEHFKDITPQNIIGLQVCQLYIFWCPLSRSHQVASDSESWWRYTKRRRCCGEQCKIDMTHGRKNPLECINFFEDYGSVEKFPIPDARISHLLPECCQDMIVRVYSKKPELVC